MQIEIVCTVLLTQGKEARVSIDDLDLLDGYAWYAYKKRNTWHVAATYKDTNGINKHIKMHRLIMGVTDPETKVDHWNHNGLDNTRGNLRVATSAQNSANTKRQQKYRLSKYMGVTPVRHKRLDGTLRWFAQCGKDGATYYGGTHKTEEEAALAYNELARRLHGEFASLNTVPCK